MYRVFSGSDVDAALGEIEDLGSDEEAELSDSNSGGWVNVPQDGDSATDEEGSMISIGSLSGEEDEEGEMEVEELVFCCCCLPTVGPLLRLVLLPHLFCYVFRWSLA